MTATSAAFTSLEDVLSVFATTQGANRAALFAEGDALILASEPATLAALGFARITQLYAAVGGATSMSKRTLLYRVQVAATFVTDDERGVPVAWDVYRVASGMTNPAYWLNRAYEDHLSADKLRTVYKAAEGRAPDETRITWPLRNVDVILSRIRKGERGGLYVTFLVVDETKVDMAALTAASVGQLSFSVVQEVAQEAEAA